MDVWSGSLFSRSVFATRFVGVYPVLMEHMDINQTTLNDKQKAWLRRQAAEVREEFEHLAAWLEYEQDLSRNRAEMYALNHLQRKRL